MVAIEYARIARTKERICNVTVGVTESRAYVHSHLYACEDHGDSSSQTWGDYTHKGDY